MRRIIETLARDYEVVLVTAGSPVDHAGMRAGVRVVSLPVGWAGPRLGQLLYHPLLVLAALFLRHDLWIESFTPPFSSSFLPVVTGRPVVGLAQTLSAREMARKYRLAFLLRIERFALRRYGHVVVFNPYDRQLVSDCNPRARVRLIPNVLAMPAEPPAGTGAERAAGTGAERAAGTGAERAAGPGAEDFCLFLGRLDITQKGLDLLADAYAGADPEPLPLVIPA